MTNIAIRIEGISKQYRIGRIRSNYTTLRDSLSNALLSPLRRAGRLLRGQASGPGESSEEHIWALRNVSLEIERGEIIGIVGRNGAGKSTLLKVLTRITEPTEGRVEIRGRVGSLLEVGTGFHPELTGRENTYLNGAILGMRRAEIDRKFDEIVEFAEIGKFIDTPVKHYSSGMYTRLAFGVAAHLEPEVLIVDEVLAVGDLAFQKKCLGKMKSIARSGRTVVFVSHNMSTVQSLCSRAIVIRQGQVAFDGPSDDAIRNYLSYLTSSATNAFVDNPERSGSGQIRLTGARVLSASGEPSKHLIAGEPAVFEFDYENPDDAKQVQVGFTIFNHMGNAASNFDSHLQDGEMTDLGGKGKFICQIPNLPFPLGEYRVAIAVRVQGQTADLIPNALVFEVASSTFYKTGRTPNIQYAACMVEHAWKHESDPQLVPTGAEGITRNSA